MGVDIARQSLESLFFQNKVHAKYAEPFQVAQDLFSELLAEHSTISVERSTLPGLDRGNYYTLGFSAQRKEGFSSCYSTIYWKTSLGLVLCVRLDSQDVPIAVVGFERMPERILITQLEKVKLEEAKGREGYLHQLHWKALLCRAVIVLAGALKLPEVCIHPICLSDAHALNSKFPERYQFHWDERAEVYRCDIRA